MSARRFVLHRRTEGGAFLAIGDGVAFDDGYCVVHQRGDARRTSLHLSVAEVERMYNRSGKRTSLDWIDEEELPS